jgi:hypothetical protein
MVGPGTLISNGRRVRAPDNAKLLMKMIGEEAQEAFAETA